MSASGRELPSVAFYYPGPIWNSGDWVKTLLLFFDGVALLVPSYMKNRPEHLDPAIAQPLIDEGLLMILEPETLVDETATAELAVSLGTLLSEGAFDDLASSDSAFAELSYSRLGGWGDEKLAESLLSELKKRGLARDTEDGVSIPMHPVVRSTVLVLLAQILRHKGPDVGLELWPATDMPRLVQALVETLSLPTAPSIGDAVQADLATVTVDLETEPLEEVLQFREEYGEEFRAYARQLRKFVRELSLLEPSQRAEVFHDRQQELDDLAIRLRRTSRERWKKPAGFAMSAVGAVWSATTLDPWAAIIGTTGGAALRSTAGQPAEAGAFSYLFRAQDRFR